MIKTITLSPVQLQNANSIVTKKSRLAELSKEVADQETQFLNMVLDKEGITDRPVDVKIVGDKIAFTFEDKKEEKT